MNIEIKERKEYLNKIIPFINTPLIKVITGVRRCGKSSFLRLIKNHVQANEACTVLYINKDSLEFDEMTTYRQLVEYVHAQFEGKTGKRYLFIDEVQEIEGWEKALSGFLTDNTADLFVTGSNSRMLSSELATYITGRYIEIKMNTLTFAEHLQFRNVQTSDQYELEFDVFMRYGGFPGIHQMMWNDDVLNQYISSIVNTIVLNDVVARNQLRDYSLLTRIIKFIASNSGNITSAKSIADYIKSQRIKCSVETVQNYIEMLCAAYIVFKVQRFDTEGKRYLEINEKYYMSDIGIKHSLLGFKTMDIAGHLENIVYLELRKRGYSIAIGKVESQEIDFVCTRNRETLYVQVCYLLADEKTIAREFGVFEKVKDNYPKLVLSLDKHLDSDRNGIQWRNIIDFLTENWQ